MIHKILNLTRPLVIFDTETTGLKHETDRIVQLGFEIWTADGLQKTWRGLVNPGISIPPETSAIHGILDEHMMLCVMCSKIEDDCVCERFERVRSFKEMAPGLAKGFSGCDFGGQNVRFDLRFLFHEMVRAGEKWDYKGSRIIDSKQMETVGEPRSLTDLYLKHTGMALENAHDALADVIASRIVMTAQLEKYERLPKDMDALHEVLWPGWIDSEGVFRFREDGVPVISLGAHRGKAMKDIPKDYYWWIVNKSTFSEEIKIIARAAEKKVFPVKDTK